MMRSLLFVPADDAKKQQKALNSATDAVILDLEDSVAPNNKAKARDVLRTFLTELDSDKKIIVRINALDTKFWQEDLELALAFAPDYILLPKARNGDDVKTVNELIHAHQKASQKTQIIALVTEVPEAMFKMDSFKDSGDRLSAMTWGAEDLSAEIGAQTNKDEDGNYFAVYQLARSFCLLGAAHANVAAIDSVYTDFKNTEGLRRETERAKLEGFTGKMLIHPNQIDIVNEVFTPNDAEIEHAKQVIAAIENSTTGGVAQLDGKMIDMPHYRRALNLINK